MCVQPRQRSRSSGPVILLHDLSGLGLCAVMALGLFKAVVLQSLSLSLSLSFCLSLSLSLVLYAPHGQVRPGLGSICPRGPYEDVLGHINIMIMIFLALVAWQYPMHQTLATPVQCLLVPVLINHPWDYGA